MEPPNTKKAVISSAHILIEGELRAELLGGGDNTRVNRLVVSRETDGDHSIEPMDLGNELLSCVVSIDRGDESLVLCYSGVESAFSANKDWSGAL